MGVIWMLHTWVIHMLQVGVIWRLHTCVIRRLHVWGCMEVTYRGCTEVTGKCCFSVSGGLHLSSARTATPFPSQFCLSSLLRRWHPFPFSPLAVLHVLQCRRHSHFRSPWRGGQCLQRAPPLPWGASLTAPSSPPCWRRARDSRSRPTGACETTGLGREW